MPNIKKVQDYPAEYYSLFRKVHTRGPFEIHFESTQAARNFRTEMYQFRSALRKALRAAPTDDDIAVAVLFAEGIKFSIVKNTLTLAKTDTIHAQKIREIL